MLDDSRIRSSRRNVYPAKVGIWYQADPTPKSLAASSLRRRSTGARVISIGSFSAAFSSTLSASSRLRVLCSCSRSVSRFVSAGKISADNAKAKAELEYDAYRRQIDENPRTIDAHFDQAAKQLTKRARPK